MASLLEHDDDPQARALALSKARDEYQWDHDYLAPLPMLRIGRDTHRPGIIEFLLGSFFEIPEAERPDDDMPKDRAAATAPALPALALDEVLSRVGRKPDDAHDYLRLLNGVPTSPNVEGNRSWAADWDSDFAFAWQRIAGPNPVVVERPDAARWADLRPRLGIDDDVVREAMGEGAPALEELLAAGSLLVCDYAMLEDPTPLPCGTSDGQQKYLPAPIVALAWDARRHELVPLAIRTGQRSDSPLVVRDGSDRWQAAKAMAAAADFNHHEMDTHLCRTHFVQEGIWVATRRSLPPQHPVAALLAPHMKYLLLNNFAGRELLVEPGGFVEDVLAGQLDAGSLELVRRAYRRFSFDDLDVPAALARRNVAATAGLPVYPYRDDALPIWAAIGRWVRGYIDGYWSDDASVAHDTELARWCQELTNPEDAHLKGFPERIESRDALATVLERLLFLAGPQHAAVNYPQSMSMSVVPNMPGAAYTVEPGRLIDALPPLEAAAAQVEIIWTLTCFQYGRLGQYGPAIGDLTVQGPLAAFQAELEGIEAAVAERNRTERASAPYLYLAPSRIPNSTNI